MASKRLRTHLTPQQRQTQARAVYGTMGKGGKGVINQQSTRTQERILTSPGFVRQAARQSDTRKVVKNRRAATNAANKVVNQARAGDTRRARVRQRVLTQGPQTGPKAPPRQAMAQQAAQTIKQARQGDYRRITEQKKRVQAQPQPQQKQDKRAFKQGGRRLATAYTLRQIGRGAVGPALRTLRNLGR